MNLTGALPLSYKASFDALTGFEPVTSCLPDNPTSSAFPNAVEFSRTGTRESNPMTVAISVVPTPAQEVEARPMERFFLPCDRVLWSPSCVYVVLRTTVVRTNRGQ